MKNLMQALYGLVIIGVVLTALATALRLALVALGMAN
jgi:hypothetical protein